MHKGYRKIKLNLFRIQGFNEFIISINDCILFQTYLRVINII